MQYDKKVIDINTHPYLLEDVCRTQEQYQLVYDVTGLYTTAWQACLRPLHGSTVRRLI